MKKVISFLAIFALLAIPVLPSDAQFGRQITVTAGTPIRLAATKTIVASLFIQMKHGGTGLGLVYSSDPAGSCAVNTLVAELAPATSTAPGGSYTFPSNGPATTEAGGFDISWVCIDGSNSGDVIISNWNPK